MTSKEYDLLLFLAEHPDTVFSKDRLFDSVWGVDAYEMSPRSRCTSNTSGIKLNSTPTAPSTLRPSGG